MKKVIAILITAVMLFTVAAPAAFAVQKENIPLIDLRGFMSYTVYADKDDPDSAQAFPPTTDKILSLVKDLVPALSALAVTNDWNKFGKTFIPVLNDLMGPLCFDNNGEAQYNTGVHFPYPTKEELEANGLDTDFIYDWREDPFLSAEKLDAFVRYLTDDLGYPAVSIECHSYGGVVLLTYLSEYGTDRVHSACFNASAVYGAAFAGELLTGNVSITGEALGEFLKGLFSQKDMELILASLTDALTKAGITGLVSDFATKLFTRLSDVIWSESLIPIFGNWPSIWSLCPDDKFDEAKQFVFDNYFSKDGADHSALEAKIELYNTEIRSRRVERLNAVNDSTNLYVIARYGYYGVPLGTIWNSNTDTVLDTAVEAFGAQCKAVSDTARFPESEFVSPNGAIDASSCLFPEQTWFIRNCKHTQREDSIREFGSAIARYDGQATVDTFSEYPRYLLFNAANAQVVPDDNGTYYKESFLNKVVLFFRKINDFFRRVFSFDFLFGNKG